MSNVCYYVLIRARVTRLCTGSMVEQNGFDRSLIDLSQGYNVLRRVDLIKKIKMRKTDNGKY